MNDTKKLDVQICIKGLGWIILGVLRRENAKRPRGYVKLKDIREKSEIRKKLEASGGNSVFDKVILSTFNMRNMLRIVALNQHTGELPTQDSINIG